MTLLDSNIIIYAALPESRELRRWIENCEPTASAISMVETLGFRKLAPAERAYLGSFFAAVHVFPVSDVVIQHAVVLRQHRKMSLGDALVGATAIVHQVELATRNVRDFDWIAGMKIIDPIAATSSS